MLFVTFWVTHSEWFVSVWTTAPLLNTRKRNWKRVFSVRCYLTSCFYSKKALVTSGGEHKLVLLRSLRTRMDPSRGLNGMSILATQSRGSDWDSFPALTLKTNQTKLKLLELEVGKQFVLCLVAVRWSTNQQFVQISTSTSYTQHWNLKSRISRF